jgi:hypothetical protein
MMDALHNGDVEIVSPAFMNTRALAESRRFMSRPIPSRSAASPVQADEVDPDVFAKADKVEQIELEREEVTSAIEAVKERVKETEDDPEAKQAAEEVLGELESKARELDEKLADPDSELED